MCMFSEIFMKFMSDFGFFFPAQNETVKEIYFNNGSGKFAEVVAEVFK